MRLYYRQLLVSLRSFLKNKPALSLITAIVIGFHLFGFIYSFIAKTPVLKPYRQQLVVRTVVMPEDPTQHLIVKKGNNTPIKIKGTTSSKSNQVAPAAKKTTSQKSQNQTNTKTIPSTTKTQKLLQDLQSSMSKIEQVRDNTASTSNINIPKPIAELKADSYHIETDNVDETSSVYKQLLVMYLKDNLHLPAYGTVKVELMLNQTGDVLSLKILSSDSEINRLYLEKNLKELSFPSFTSDLVGKKSSSFCLTFCSDE